MLRLLIVLDDAETFEGKCVAAVLHVHERADIDSHHASRLRSTRRVKTLYSPCAADAIALTTIVRIGERTIMITDVRLQSCLHAQITSALITAESALRVNRENASFFIFMLLSFIGTQ